MPPNKTGTMKPFDIHGSTPKEAFWKTERNDKTIAPRQNETINHNRYSLERILIILFISSNAGIQGHRGRQQN